MQNSQYWRSGVLKFFSIKCGVFTFDWRSNLEVDYLEKENICLSRERSKVSNFSPLSEYSKTYSWKCVARWGLQKLWKSIFLEIFSLFQSQYLNFFELFWGPPVTIYTYSETREAGLSSGRRLFFSKVIWQRYLSCKSGPHFWQKTPKSKNLSTQNLGKKKMVDFTYLLYGR
jgi:hypothetical protein